MTFPLRHENVKMFRVYPNVSGGASLGVPNVMSILTLSEKPTLEMGVTVLLIAYL